MISIQAIAIFLHIRGNLIITGLNKDISGYAVWKGWIKNKELKEIAANMNNNQERNDFENAIEMRKWSMRILYLGMIIFLIHWLLF